MAERASPIIARIALEPTLHLIVERAHTLLQADASMLALRQEGKAEASVAALQKMLLVKTRVRRGGEMLQIEADHVVPGDIVLVEAGTMLLCCLPAREQGC